MHLPRLLCAHLFFLAGSSDLWVPSVACTSAACANKHKFDASKSSTAEDLGGDFQINYDDGSSVKGPVFTDTVSVAGIQVTGQVFSPVTSISSSFGDGPSDGVSAFIWSLCGC